MKNLLATITIVFVSFITVACGTNQQGNCAAGQIFQNGVCTASGSQFYNGYNGQYNNGANAGMCSQGPSYVSNSAYGCNSANGYVQQGNQCVCQSGITGTGTNTGNNGGCQQGYYWLFNSCYPQGPCAQNYVFYTPNGMCYLRQQ